MLGEQMVNWVVLILISAVLAAFENIMRKHVLKNQHPLEMLAGESFTRIIPLLIMIPFVSVPSFGVLLVIFCTAFLLLALMIYKNRAYRHLPISVVAPLQNLSPAFLVVLAFLLLGETPTLVQIGGILLVMVGGYVLELKGKKLFDPLKSFTQGRYAGVIVMLLILLSVMAMANKAILDQTGINPFDYLFWTYLFFTVISIGADGAVYRLQGVWDDIKSSGWMLLGISSITLLGIYAFYAGIAQPGVLIALAIPIRRMATLLETVLGGSLFHEDNIWRKAVGCGIMLLGVLFIV